jgi:hypothetical protein
VAGDELAPLLSKILAEMRTFVEGPTGEVPVLHMAAKRMTKSSKTLSRRNTRN